MGELTLFYYFHLATFLAYVCSVMEALLTGICGSTIQEKYWSQNQPTRIIACT